MKVKLSVIPPKGLSHQQFAGLQRNVRFNASVLSSSVDFCSELQETSPGFNRTRPMQFNYADLINWNLTKVTGNNWLTGIQWNISVIGENEPGPGENGFFGFRAFPFWEAGVVIVRSHNDMQYMAGYDYDTGAFLWKNNATILDIGVRDPVGGPSGPIMLHDGASKSIVAYNVTTGEEQWRVPDGELPWGMLPAYSYVINFPERRFYYGSYDGHVYAVDADTGDPYGQATI